MRTLVWVWLGVTAMASCAPAAAATRAPTTAPACRPADATANRTIDELKEDVVSTDPTTRGLLDSLKITATRASDVAYVTDEKTCAKAVTALRTLWAGRSTSDQVHVYKVGTDFLVEDPSLDQGADFRGLQVFDRRWVYKSTFLTN